MQMTDLAGAKRPIPTSGRRSAASSQSQLLEEGVRYLLLSVRPLRKIMCTPLFLQRLFYDSVSPAPCDGWMALDVSTLHHGCVQDRKRHASWMTPMDGHINGACAVWKP